jgi:hypothetical protein
MPPYDFIDKYRSPYKICNNTKIGYIGEYHEYQNRTSFKN